jgi:hypothetical protein
MNHHPIFGFQTLAKALSFALAVQLTGIPALGQTIPTALNIVVVEGEGDTGPVRQRPNHVPVIRVVDENEKPVSGAAVVFTLPTEGSTGVFPNGAKTLMVLTDASGEATAQGLRFNQLPGKVPVNINVSYKGLTAHTNVTQTSVAPAGYKPGGTGHTGRLVTILVIVAAGGAGGAVYATRKSSNPTTAVTPAGPQPIGITAGTATLAPPH